VVDSGFRQPCSARTPSELVGLTCPTTEGSDNIVDIITELVCIYDILETLKRNIETRPRCVLRYQASVAKGQLTPGRSLFPAEGSQVKSH